MKLIKKYDENGNEYYEEILETNEEIQNSINNTIKKNKKRNKKAWIKFLICILFLILFILIFLNKIPIEFIEQNHYLIGTLGFIFTSAIIERLARKK